MSEIFYDDDLAELYNAGLEWIQERWKGYEITYKRVGPKTIGRNRGFVLNVLLENGEDDCKFVKYFAKIQDLELDMVLSHWILKELKCGPERCFFLPVKRSKFGPNDWFKRPMELGMITENVEKLHTARQIRTYAQKDSVLDKAETFLADSFLLSIAVHLCQFTRIPDNSDNWGFVGLKPDAAKEQAKAHRLSIIDFSSYDYWYDCFQSKSSFIRFWVTQVTSMMSRCSIVDPQKRGWADWECIVKQALDLQCNHFPWLQNKAAFLTELQRACDQTAEWLHQVATRSIAPSPVAAVVDTASGSAVGLDKEPTAHDTQAADGPASTTVDSDSPADSAVPATAAPSTATSPPPQAPDYDRSIEMMDKARRCGLVYLSPSDLDAGSARVTPELLVAAQAIVDGAEQIIYHLKEMMLLKQPSYWDCQAAVKEFGALVGPFEALCAAAEAPPPTSHDLVPSSDNNTAAPVVENLTSTTIADASSWSAATAAAATLEQPLARSLADSELVATPAGRDAALQNVAAPTEAPAAPGPALGATAVASEASAPLANDSISAATLECAPESRATTLFRADATPTEPVALTAEAAVIISVDPVEPSAGVDQPAACAYAAHSEACLQGATTTLRGQSPSLGMDPLSAQELAPRFTPDESSAISAATAPVSEPTVLLDGSTPVEEEILRAATEAPPEEAAASEKVLGVEQVSLCLPLSSLG